MTDARIVELSVGGQRAALPVEAVREVLGAAELRPVADGPGFVAGSVRTRGETIPVIDLRDRFGMDASPGSARIVVLEHDRAGAVGVRVDAVAGVREVDAGALARPPRQTAGEGGQYVRGIATVDGELVLVLAGERLLSAPEIDALTELRSRWTTNQAER